jgi:hypothetical protein
MTHDNGSVRLTSADKKRRRTVDAQEVTCTHVLPDAHSSGTFEAQLELSHVKAEFLGRLSRVRAGRRKEKIVHLPELTLTRGAVRAFRNPKSAWMQRKDWQMPKCEDHFAPGDVFLLDPRQDFPCEQAAELALKI